MATRIQKQLRKTRIKLQQPHTTIHHQTTRNQRKPMVPILSCTDVNMRQAVDHPPVAWLNGKPKTQTQGA